MTMIAIAMFAVLAVIALLHLSWALGSHWPARNDRDLLALVVVSANRDRMPGVAATLLAALAIFGAGVVGLAIGGVIVVPWPDDWSTLAGFVVAAVFFARGLAAYLPAWRSRFSLQPFAHLDQTYYGPLCLILAFGFTLLLFARVGGMDDASLS